MFAINNKAQEEFDIYIGQCTTLREEREDIVNLSCFVVLEIMEEVIYQFEVTWHVR